MMKDNFVDKGGIGMEKQHDSRRSFLKHILAGAGVVAGSVAVVRSAKARPIKPDLAKDHDLYRETSAFNKYYKSLRS
jgi:hypothetical protein